MIVTYPIAIQGNVSTGGAFSLTGSILISTFNKDSEYYEGQYTFYPTTNDQTIPTADRVLEQNIIVKAIPSNYGLITWNGSYLTVS